MEQFARIDVGIDRQMEARRWGISKARRGAQDLPRPWLCSGRPELQADDARIVRSRYSAFYWPWCRCHSQSRTISVATWQTRL